MSPLVTVTRVLIVDDSALVRRMLTEVLDADPEIEVVGTAEDAYAARAKIKQLNPDVITLDVEMPKMDGLTFLRHLMRLHPMPVVMISSLTERGANVTLDALAIGAVDFIGKPALDVANRLQEYAQEVIGTVKSAPAIFRRSAAIRRLRAPLRPIDARSAGALGHAAAEKVVAMGASTGGLWPFATSSTRSRRISRARRSSSTFLPRSAVSLQGGSTNLPR